MGWVSLNYLIKLSLLLVWKILSLKVYLSIKQNNLLMEPFDNQKECTHIGRPTMNKEEQNFFKCKKLNQRRIQLQCLILTSIYDYFKCKTSNVLSSSVVKSLFQKQGFSFLYERLIAARNVSNLLLPPLLAQKYTSKRDILYTLHQIAKGFTPSGIVSARELFFFVLFFLSISDLLIKQVCLFMLNSEKRFIEIMRNGPESRQNEDQPAYILELLVRFALELAKNQNLKIEF